MVWMIIQKLTEPDSDSDNIADYLELDSDGDGCSDVSRGRIYGCKWG